MRQVCDARDCEHGTHDVLCRECRDELLLALCDLVFTVNRDGRRGPGLCEALDDTAAGRRSRGGSRPRPRAGESTSLPFNSRASATAERLANTISSWARSLAEAFPSLHPSYTTVVGACEWMIAHPRELAVFWKAGRMHSEITRVVARIERVVDLREDLHFLGMCSAAFEGALCDEDLFARAGRTTVVCRACGTTHDVAYRRAVLSQSAEDQLASAVDCSRLAPHLLGRELSPSTVRGWARTGRLAQYPPHPHDPRRAPRYRLGEVVALARETQTRRRPGKASSSTADA
ncbi:hypothetical protein [Prauserella flavalba]|uniref:hypothetical protein n=1 Tax=Prauserella flavalba TaxID=1477506 RepID=UPI0036E68FB8